MRTITLENGKEVKISQQSYEELQKAVQEEVFDVPNWLDIERRNEADHIVFDKGRQVMACYNRYGRNYLSVTFTGAVSDPTYFLINKENYCFVPIERKDLKVGDIVMFSDHSFVDAYRLQQAGIIFDDKFYYKVSEFANIYRYKSDWNYWWKLVKRSDL